MNQDEPPITAILSRARSPAFRLRARARARAKLVTRQAEKQVQWILLLGEAGWVAGVHHDNSFVALGLWINNGKTWMICMSYSF